MIGIGVNCSQWDGAVEAALLQLQPSIIVATDPVNWDTIGRCKLASFPCAVIYRPILDGNRPDNHGMNPNDLADFTLAQLNQRWQLIDAVQGYNEVITSNNVAEQGPRELAYLRRMQGEGIPVVALNAGVGQLEPEHIAMLLDIFREGYVGAHGYLDAFARVLEDDPTPDYFRRPERKWLPVLAAHGLDLSRTLFTESGTYYDPERSGVSWEAYARLLIAIHEYALGLGMMGTCGFTLAGYEPWQTQQPWQLVEHPEALAILAQYNREHAGPPPVFTVRQQSPVGAHSARSGTAEVNGGTAMADNFSNMILGPGMVTKALELGPTRTGKQLTGEIYLKDGQGKDTYSYAVFEKCEIRYYPGINLVVALPFW